MFFKTTLPALVVRGSRRQVEELVGHFVDTRKRERERERDRRLHTLAGGTAPTTALSNNIILRDTTELRISAAFVVARCNVRREY
jgi:hypothetical protein